MSDSIWIALALVLILEGVGPMLFPNKWQKYIQELAAQPVSQLRSIGGALVTVGVISLIFLL